MFKFIFAMPQRQVSARHDTEHGGFVLFEEAGRLFLRRGLVCELGQVHALWRDGKGSGGCGRPEVVGRRGIKKSEV